MATDLQKIINVRTFSLQSDYFHHFERLGVGHAVEFIHNSLNLLHNEIYYFNLQLLNYIGYENIISSIPIIMDFTTPAPGILANISDETFVHEPCVSFIHAKWHHLCISDTPLRNHR